MCPQLLIALKSVMGLFSPLGCRFGTSINTYRRDCFTLFGNVAAPYPFDNKVQFTSIHYHVSSFLAIAIYYKYFSHIYTISLNIEKAVYQVYRFFFLTLFQIVVVDAAEGCVGGEGRLWVGAEQRYLCAAYASVCIIDCVIVVVVRFTARVYRFLCVIF